MQQHFLKCTKEGLLEVAKASMVQQQGLKKSKGRAKSTCSFIQKCTYTSPSPLANTKKKSQVFRLLEVTQSRRLFGVALTLHPFFHAPYTNFYFGCWAWGLGAFIAGVPVQPVLIRYPNSLDTTSWAWRGPGVLKVLWLTASQPCSLVDVEFLPVYQPSPEESSNPTLYANNVQRVMAQALGIPATECEFVGNLPVTVVGQLKVALEPQLWELGKVLRKAGLSPGCVDAGAEPGRSRMVSKEEFAKQLQLSDSHTVAGAFDYFQQDSRGSVDFRDVALALAALDGGRSLEELTRLAFELFAEEEPEGPGRLLYKDGFGTILYLLLGSPRPSTAALHAELCQSTPTQGLSLCQFQNFSLHDPLYGRLFSTYLRPPYTLRANPQSPEATSHGIPIPTSNGTVNTSKPKND
ncbi:lysophospholipid acyltransferase LPCAT4 [Petaurus breviceps papuanus]|uniref:lysophospholipid acyltransferase LPCAT4 n=1 Tax=Petaurus breviceps papuanus TaxID=3040969 RepID=UPI0036DCCB38